MRFYNRQHRHYCGVDLHVKTMYICILDSAGLVLVHRNVKSTPEAFLEIVAPYREDLVVAAECMNDVQHAYDVIDQSLDARQQALFRLFEQEIEQRQLQLLMRARQQNRANRPNANPQSR